MRKETLWKQKNQASCSLSPVTMLFVLLRAPVASHVSPCGHLSELYADVCCDHQSTSIAPREQERRLARSFFKKIRTYLRRTWLFCRQEKNSRSKIADIDYLKFHRHPSWNVVTGLQSTVEAKLAEMYHPFTEHGMTRITRENGSDVLFMTLMTNFQGLKGSGDGQWTEGSGSFQSTWTRTRCFCP